MTGMWYLEEIIADFGSVEHPMFTKMIIYAAVQRIITQFDDGDHEIHHTHDFAPLLRPPAGGANGANAVTSHHGCRFE